MFIIIIILLALIAGIVGCVIGGYHSSKSGTKATLWSFTLLFSAPFLLFALLMISLSSSKPTAEALIASSVYILFEALLLLIVFRWIRRRIVWVSLLTAFCCLGIGSGVFYHNWAYERSLAVVSESSNLLWQYDPSNPNNALAVLEEPSSLTLTEDLPVLDGATALYPVYAAFANAVYPQEVLSPPIEGEDAWAYLEDPQSEVLLCSKTTEAYRCLVDGEADIIFVAGPSDAQLQYAADKDEEMVFTPIGRECFVFFVNANNPVSDLSVDQIREIYSGEITHWKEFGANLGKIRAFQRDEGSGSQSALVRFMGDSPLMEPQKENVVQGMGGIIEKTADYRNFPNAIGYSFRFYATEMVRNGEIKLLEINGIAPTKANILDDSYPVCDSFYAVTLASNKNPNVSSFIEWILSEQGQHLIDKTGYAALN